MSRYNIISWFAVIAKITAIYLIWCALDVVTNTASIINNIALVLIKILSYTSG